MKVVTEGVEDEAVEAVLLSLGCDLIQGYLISTALPPAELERFLASSAPRLRRAAAS